MSLAKYMCHSLSGEITLYKCCCSPAAGYAPTPQVGRLKVSWVLRIVAMVEAQTTTQDDSTDAEDMSIQEVGVGDGDYGRIRVPAHVQREQGICIDDTVEVTLSNLNHRYVDSVSFTNKQQSGDYVTIPTDLMGEMGFEQGEEVDADYQKVEGEVCGEDDESKRLEDIEDEIDEFESESESDKPEGLGELFA